MPEQTIRDIINRAVDRAVRQVLPAIKRELAEVETQSRQQGHPKASRRSRRPSSRRVEMTKWVADIRARRVPKFVIEATGLDTKKKIVAKFGESAAFEKGRPLPKAQAIAGTVSGGKEAARVVRARPPVVRKAAASQ